MNIQRIAAIFEKDLKEFMKNSMLFFMPLLPIILAIFYGRMGAEEEMPAMVIYIVVGITFSAVTSACMMIMMAEEHEKNTLRGLIISPASFLDIILGKSLVTALLTFISLIISLYFVGFELFFSIQAIIGLCLLFFFFLFLGIGVGLFVKSVGMTSAYMMPIMFFFGFTSMVEFLNFKEDSIVLKVADTFPIPQLISMDETGSWVPLGIVFLWVIGAFLFTYICFIKTKQDVA